MSLFDSTLEEKMKPQIDGKYHGLTTEGREIIVSHDLIIMEYQSQIEKANGRSLSWPDNPENPDYWKQFVSPATGVKFNAVAPSITPSKRTERAIELLRKGLADNNNGDYEEDYETLVGAVKDAIIWLEAKGEYQV